MTHNIEPMRRGSLFEDYSPQSWSSSSCPVRLSRSHTSIHHPFIVSAWNASDQNTFQDVYVDHRCINTRAKTDQRSHRASRNEASTARKYTIGYFYLFIFFFSSPPEVHQSSVKDMGREGDCSVRIQGNTVDPDHQNICDMNHKSTDATIDSGDVVYWLLDQTCRGIEQLQPLYIPQGIYFCRRADAAMSNPDHHTDPGPQLSDNNIGVRELDCYGFKKMREITACMAAGLLTGIYAWYEGDLYGLSTIMSRVGNLTHGSSHHPLYPIANSV